MFENSVLRKVFGPQKEFRGNGKSFYDGELPDLFFSPNLVIVASSRKMR